jgi:hypothetical protein
VPLAHWLLLLLLLLLLLPLLLLPLLHPALPTRNGSFCWCT